MLSCAILWDVQSLAPSDTSWLNLLGRTHVVTLVLGTAQCIFFLPRIRWWISCISRQVSVTDFAQKLSNIFQNVNKTQWQNDSAERCYATKRCFLLSHEVIPGSMAVHVLNFGSFISTATAALSVIKLTPLFFFFRALLSPSDTFWP